MESAILAIGTSVPDHFFSQMDLANHLINYLNLDDEKAWIVQKIYKNSCISHRYFAGSDFLNHILGKKYLKSTFIGMSQRNGYYKTEAPILAKNAAQAAFNSWTRPPSDITHVISVSCTGAITPGLEHKLCESFNLNPHTALLGINFMGCFGAFKALKVADAIAKENPANRILIVCTELCTLHFKLKDDIESFVIQSLFADGASAAIVGVQPMGNETPLFEILSSGSCTVPETQADMTWDACDEGFDMTLSQRVPHLIEKHISSFFKRLAKDNLQPRDMDYAIHPGGKSILESVERGLDLSRASTQSSWNILENYGNLSSATFLHVLHDLSKRKQTKRNIVGLGFGPGLTIEGLVLNKIE